MKNLGYVKCPFCKEEIESEKEHVEECEKRETFSLKNKVITFENTLFCAICFYSTTKSNELSNHSKRTSNCDRFRKNNLTKQIEDKDNDRTDEDNLKTYLDIILTKAKEYVNSWIKRNPHISRKNLIKIFDEFTQQTLENLAQKEINVLNIEDLKKKTPKIEWTHILERSEDIFDKKLLKTRLDQLNSSEQRKIIKNLNLIYREHYEGLLLPFDSSEKKNKSLIHPADFLCFIRKLFDLKKEKYIYFAIDLLVLLQTGIRFPSEKMLVEDNLEELLANRYIKVDFANSHRILCFSSQLIKIIKSAKWVNFVHEKILMRLNQYFEWTSDSIRQSRSKIAFFSMEECDREEIRKKLKHSFENITQGFINEKLTLQLKIVETLKIPDFEEVSENQIKIDFSDFDAEEYIKCPNEIPTAFINKIKAIGEGETLILPDIFPKNSSNEKIKSEIVEIQVGFYQVCFNKEQGDFLVEKFYQKIEKKEKCLFCSEISETCRQCPICNAVFHLKCIKISCSNCMARSGVMYDGVTPLNKDRLKLDVSMFEHYESNFLFNMRFLMSLRRFHYTSVCRTVYGQTKAKISRVTSEIHFSQAVWKKYSDEKLNPPLKLGLSGEDSNYGAGFGVFAATDIKANVFIGEYAADICTVKESAVSKRDSIFVIGNVQIAPIIHCGYVPLINEARKKEPNCIAIHCVILDKARVILHTIKDIKKNEELLYDYRLDSQKQICKLVNPGFSTCYLSIIQLFHCIHRSDHNFSLKIFESFDKAKYNPENEIKTWNKELKLESSTEHNVVFLLESLIIFEKLKESFSGESIKEFSCCKRVEQEEFIIAPAIPSQTRISAILNGKSFEEEIICAKCKIKSAVQLSFHQKKQFFLISLQKTNEADLDLSKIGEPEFRLIATINHCGESKNSFYSATVLENEHFYECVDVNISKIYEIKKKNCDILAFERLYSLD